MGNYWQEIFQGISFEISWWDLSFRIPSWIPQHYPLFVSVAILTKNVEVDNNAHDESCELSCDKHV